jgi:hypothetical protein
MVYMKVEERLLEYEEMRQHRLRRAAEKLDAEARKNAKPQVFMWSYYLCIDNLYVVVLFMYG